MGDPARSRYAVRVEHAHDSNSITRVRASFGRQGLMALLGARLVTADAGNCVIELPYAATIGQQHGYFHGGALGAIADSAAGYAALSLTPPDREVLTVEYKINFLAPAIGQLAVARGQVISAGRRIFVCSSTVTVLAGERETLCATMLQTIATTAAGVGDAG
jgi:uncharacterized protein (TIGR00369 family)